MMTISLELPEGVAPPKMRGTLTGPPDDLRIEIRLADFVSALKEAQAAGATVQMVPSFRARAAKKAARKKSVPAQGSVSTGTRPSPSQDAIIAWLEQGDSTREIVKGVAKKLDTSVDAIGQAFEKVKAKGLIERYDDEANGGLPKWRLVK